MQLTTPRLVLREQTLDDAEAVNRYESMPSVMRYMTPPPRDLAATREYIQKAIDGQSVEPRLLYDMAITLRSGSPMIGRAGLMYDDEKRHNAAIWYVLHPDYQGQGLATEAMTEMLRFGFEELEVHRIWADVDPRNPPSVALLERLGLRREAHHIRNVLIKEEWCDTLIYALLLDEYRTRPR